MNTKYHKELPDIVQAWNQQLKTEAKATSYLSGVEVVLEEGEKLMKKKAAAKTATKAGTRWICDDTKEIPFSSSRALSPKEYFF